MEAQGTLDISLQNRLEPKQQTIEMQGSHITSGTIRQVQKHVIIQAQARTIATLTISHSTEKNMKPWREDK